MREAPLETVWGPFSPLLRPSSWDRNALRPPRSLPTPGDRRRDRRPASLTRPPDPDITIFNYVDLGLQGERTVIGEFDGGFEHLAVAGASGFIAGDDHFYLIPAAVLVILEGLVGADPRIVADLELVCEGLVAQMQAAIRVPGG